MRVVSMMIRVAVVWTCPNCKRTFGKTNQGHTCAPAMTEDEYFATGPPFERPIFDEVRGFLTGVGSDVRVEFVSVGVFFKRRTTFSELRPLTKWSNLSFKLPRHLDHPKITRAWKGPNGSYCVVRLKVPSDVDDIVRGWLAEAYAEDE